MRMLFLENVRSHQSWNVTSLAGNKPELVQDGEWYQVDNWAHLYVWHLVWNQSPGEGLNSLLFQSCPG